MGIFALGLFVVLVTGGIDISFAAIASTIQYTVATIAMRYGIQDPLIGIIISIILGLLFGSLNAFLIYYFKVVSIIVTISMQSILFGVLMWITQGRNIYLLPDWMTSFFQIIPFLHFFNFNCIYNFCINLCGSNTSMS